uniref:Sulfatase N-terminal domain-containing protein n=1 Tax=Plectus sambesii TaxID=2011161 RepID=A0A914W0K0_9BILA
MHTQIIPQKLTPVPGLSSDAIQLSLYRPSVMIIVIDSASSSSFLRSMPRTLQVLTDLYGVTVFRGLNKVADNSAPNAHAFLNGVRSDKLMIDDYVLKPEVPDWCHRYLNASKFIGTQFVKAGYVTMMADDGPKAIFGWPNCYGFKQKPIHHYLRPYHIRIDPDSMSSEEFAEDTADLLFQIREQQCKETYDVVMEYQKQFLNAYPASVPKFSLIWLTALTHDTINGLFHVDDYFAEFFRQYQSQLSNSFVFFMADHGPRWGDIREGYVGRLEDNNPMLVVAVPEPLRKNKQLKANMNMNANRLVSQYDVYTTLFDISTVAAQSNWTDLSAIDWTSKGFHKRQTSFLRPVDLTRSCRLMQIPELYCLCESDEKYISTDDPTVLSAAQYLTNQLMKQIDESGARTICADLSLVNIVMATTNIVRSFNGEQNRVEYVVMFMVAPSKGIFQGLVELVNGQFRMPSSRLSRINAYGTDSHCTQDALIMPVCYCRDLV